MSDIYSKHYPSPLGPAINAFEITPNDSVDLAYTTTEIFVGTGGNVAVRMSGTDDPNSNVVFRNVESGKPLRIRATKVYSTGTTASNLVGLV